ncbi:hypothetical protein EKO27_g4161 [Xylaria grammica]|uniref:Uncharacterized protein n=1 Tax=Xylaria grammica TaxID=363999 RepID=A0A439D958_9PEZI|nr:hypothetical protein EKO27_g4161 [Xylaria grammica]
MLVYTDLWNTESNDQTGIHLTVDGGGDDLPSGTEETLSTSSGTLSASSETLSIASDDGISVAGGDGISMNSIDYDDSYNTSNNSTTGSPPRTPIPSHLPEAHHGLWQSEGRKTLLDMYYLKTRRVEKEKGTDMMMSGGAGEKVERQSKEKDKQERPPATPVHISGNSSCTVGGGNVAISGNASVTVNGGGRVAASGNAQVTVYGDSNVRVSGNANVYVYGNGEAVVSGNGSARFSGAATGTTTGNGSLYSFV